jgi:hypothetical protein
MNLIELDRCAPQKLLPSEKATSSVHIRPSLVEKRRIGDKSTFSSEGVSFQRLQHFDRESVLALSSCGAQLWLLKSKS